MQLRIFTLHFLCPATLLTALNLWYFFTSLCLGCYDWIALKIKFVTISPNTYPYKKMHWLVYSEIQTLDTGLSAESNKHFSKNILEQFEWLGKHITIYFQWMFYFWYWCSYLFWIGLLLSHLLNNIETSLIYVMFNQIVPYTREPIVLSAEYSVRDESNAQVKECNEVDWRHWRKHPQFTRGPPCNLLQRHSGLTGHSSYRVQLSPLALS